MKVVVISSAILSTVLGSHVEAGFIAVCGAAAVCLDVVGYSAGRLIGVSGGLFCSGTALESFL